MEVVAYPAKPLFPAGAKVVSTTSVRDAQSGQPSEVFAGVLDGVPLVEDAGGDHLAAITGCNSKSRIARGKGLLEVAQSEPTGERPLSAIQIEAYNIAVLPSSPFATEAVILTSKLLLSKIPTIEDSQILEEVPGGENAAPITITGNENLAQMFNQGGSDVSIIQPSLVAADVQVEGGDVGGRSVSGVVPVGAESSQQSDKVAIVQIANWNSESSAITPGAVASVPGVASKDAAKPIDQMPVDRKNPQNGVRATNSDTVEKTEITHEMPSGQTEVVNLDLTLEDTPPSVMSETDEILAVTPGETSLKEQKANRVGEVHGLGVPASETSMEVEGSSPPEPISEKSVLHDSILSQVREGVITRGENGKSQITITLNPAELGELKVLVKMEQKELHIEIQAENRMVKDLLLSDLNSLKESLGNKDLNLAGFDVSTGSGSHNPRRESGSLTLPRDVQAYREGYRQEDSQIRYMARTSERNLDIRL